MESKVSKTLLMLRQLDNRVGSVEQRLVSVESRLVGVEQNTAEMRDLLRDVRDLLKVGLFDRARVDDLDRRVTALELAR